MITITFPDGKTNNFKPGVSCLDVAKTISINFAKKCIACSIDDNLVDMSYKISKNANILFWRYDQENKISLEIIRHDAAHLLAHAVSELFPDTQIVIGPAIDDGFYYDFAKDDPFSAKDLELIESKMQEISQRDYSVDKIVMSRTEAIAFFKKQEQNFKADIIETLIKDEEVSIYTQGNFSDLCRGPHALKISYLKYFKLLRVSASYWLGDSKNKSLQRIYGTAFGLKKSLEDYLFKIEEAKKRDHRKIGKDLDLFCQQNDAIGDIFWHPKGRKLYLIIENYIRNLLEKNGYQEVKTPILVKRNLWEASGHWEKFGSNMFTSTIDEQEYAIKPMNCPCHIQIFNDNLRSYKELPIRMSEFGCCHRYEPSGSLYGIMRLRSFTQDDAHIFCTEDQITSETINFCKLLQSVYNDFGFKDILIKFSDRPNVRAGNDETWDSAENALKGAIKSAGYEYILNPGEGAFYGPKLEFILKDAIGRDWQCGTLQVDFVLPERLDAKYVSQDGSKKRPVMLHRAILGSIERFIGILIENYSGNLPLWLAPVQIAIIGINNTHIWKIKEIANFLMSNNFRVYIDDCSNTINYKIRNHAIQKIPYTVIIGDKEIKNNTVSIRKFGSDKSEIFKTEDFVSILLKCVSDKS